MNFEGELKSYVFIRSPDKILPLHGLQDFKSLPRVKELESVGY